MFSFTPKIGVYNPGEFDSQVLAQTLHEQSNHIRLDCLDLCMTTGLLKPSESFRGWGYSTRGAMCPNPIILPSLPPKLPGPYGDSNSPNHSNQVHGTATPMKPASSSICGSSPATPSSFPPTTLSRLPAPSRTSPPISKYVRSRPRSNSPIPYSATPTVAFEHAWQ